MTALTDAKTLYFSPNIWRGVENIDCTSTAVPQNVLKGQTIVLTGLFQEPSEEDDLTAGKAEMKDLLERFGARVTGSVSGKTTVLLVGCQPGRVKVTKARSIGKALVITPHVLFNGMLKNDLAAAAQDQGELDIKEEQFSKGGKDATVNVTGKKREAEPSSSDALGFGDPLGFDLVEDPLPEKRAKPPESMSDLHARLSGDSLSQQLVCF